MSRDHSDEEVPQDGGIPMMVGDIMSLVGTVILVVIELFFVLLAVSLAIWAFDQYFPLGVLYVA